MLERLQGSRWRKNKEKYCLLFVEYSERGNIRGVYQEKDSKKRISHWMNNEEKEEYLKTGGKK